MEFNRNSFSVQELRARPEITALEPQLGWPLPGLPLTIPELRIVNEFPATVNTKDLLIPSRDGTPLNARLYHNGDLNRPILIYVHGGGWTRGTLGSYNPICCRLSNLGLLVISVEYRLAPENKFPGPVYDVVDSIRWVIANRAHLRGSVGDGQDMVIVGGDSAGGQLSWSSFVSLIQEDGCLPKEIVAGLLVYPATDPAMSSESWKKLGDDYRLTRAVSRRFWDWFLGNEENRIHPLAYSKSVDPKTFSQFPPCLVISAEFDPLKQEGEEFAEYLHSQGVAVHCARFMSTLHGFFSNGISTNVPAHEPYSQLALQIVKDWLLHLKILQ
eukprot:TRINITY_DN3051_c0_g1_i1.p1 TRINITY_DN3051_c0_g1~~TRINITY_DN3051_c0_g1_i1.p1  ORF type:complete len:328 (+),score=61.51 TRINITY_DN3051_c0_g1_i1:26-1009(+)